MDATPDVRSCELCGEPLRPGQDKIHPECEDAALAAEKERICSRCGGDAYWCPCTTGWDPYRGIVW